MYADTFWLCRNGPLAAQAHSNFPAFTRGESSSGNMRNYRLENIERPSPIFFLQTDNNSEDDAIKITHNFGHDFVREPPLFDAARIPPRGSSCDPVAKSVRAFAARVAALALSPASFTGSTPPPPPPPSVDSAAAAWTHFIPASSRYSISSSL